MLLFHGTRLDRRGLRSLFAEGLRPHDRGWMHELTDERAFCFLSNAPVAGRGGDPVFFATARRYHPRTRSEGYVVVLDVTPAALESSLVGVFPNFELDQFLDASSFRARPIVNLPALIRLGRSAERDQSLFLDSAPRLRSKYQDLHLDPDDYAAWCRYADDLNAARTVADVERAGRRVGIRWETPEVLHCELCVQGMAQWELVVPTDESEPGRTLPASIDGRRVSADAWLTRARQAASWFEPHTTTDLLTTLSRLPHGATWQDILDQLHVDLARLPAPWRPDFGRTWTEATLRQDDVQLACRGLGPEHVRGAIRITEGARLAPWVRPARGDTLVSKLWRATHAMLDSYRGEPVLYTGPR